MFDNYYKELDARLEQYQLRSLCAAAASQLLAAETDEGDDQDAALTEFAVRTIQKSLGGKDVSNESFDSIVDEFVRETEQHESERASKFVANFVTHMLDHPMCLRSNSRKIAEYEILFSAACDLACSQEDEEGEPWETFSTKLASADPTFPVLDDDGTPEQFRKQIIAAFQFVVRRPGFSFVELAKAIKQAQADDSVRRYRVSRASAAFYR